MAVSLSDGAMRIFSVILVLLLSLQALPRERSFEQRVGKAALAQSLNIIRALESDG